MKLGAKKRETKTLKHNKKHKTGRHSKQNPRPGLPKS